jgi:hypothetical protein
VPSLKAHDGGLISNDSANGLFIDATGGTITNIVDITTHGEFSSGVRADGGTITLNGGTITTTGPSAHGLRAGTGGLVNATGVVVNVTGPTTAAPAIVDGGTLTLTNSTATSAQELALTSQAQTGLTNTYVIAGADWRASRIRRWLSKGVSRTSRSYVRRSSAETDSSCKLPSACSALTPSLPSSS